MITISNVGTLVISSQIQVNLTSIRNPSSFKPVIGFNVTILDELDRIVATKNNSTTSTYSTSEASQIYAILSQKSTKEG